MVQQSQVTVVRADDQIEPTGQTEADADRSSRFDTDPFERVPEPAPRARGVRRLVYVSLAGLFFVLGSLGALLPGLPATPFLLLASYFLVRTSPRLNEALLRSRIFGPILVDWQVHGGIRRHVRIKAVIVVAIAVALSIFMTGYSLLPSLVIVLLACIGITVVFWLPSAR